VADITSLRIGDIRLERDGDGWRLADLAEGEVTDQDAAAALVARLAGLNFMAVVGGGKSLPSGKPLLDAELTLSGGVTVQYRFVDPGQQGDPLLWVSDRDHVLRIASFTFQPLAAASRAQLLVSRPEAEAAPQAQ
jgi:hypothetical protein